MISISKVHTVGEDGRVTTCYTIKRNGEVVGTASVVSKHDGVFLRNMNLEHCENTDDARHVALELLSEEHGTLIIEK